MKKLSFALVLTLFVLMTQSCQKDSLTDVNDPYAGQAAPELPSEATFVMPLSELKDPKASPKTLNNWGHSVANIAVWNILISVHTAIPTLSFHAALAHDPEYQGQGVWLWAYEFSDDDGNGYRAELYGEMLATEEVKWDMYISQADGSAQVHWYTGVTANDESYASWTLNYQPENPTPFIQIDYQRDNGAGVETIRYTNIIPDIPENGGYIEYREGDGANEVFDRAYDVFKAEIDNLLEINWSSADHNGRVKDPEKYEDEAWHCWGTNLLDTDC